ncbi:DUF3142 domain-containing protein [Luteolibacter sp. GHJ8]|uniref:DUF3142 domain-containing protein n=1 Tax=Luteolibacter rhizosphaerae TaxID=2989719 RepID=A0ABT3G5C0_9BACT|nr:DUF3142 domain-containing protein [Luteolibacter rhizosphaerae]
MRPRFTAIGCFLLVLGAGCKRPAPAPAPAVSVTVSESSFWVWHRSSDLSDGEIAALRSVAAPRLYWQIAEFGWRDGKWTPRSLGKPPEPLPDGGPVIVPVVRLDPGADSLLKPEAAASLVRWLRFHYGDAPPRILQLDYDCPLRLLPRYAGYLWELKSQLGLEEISVTALASWIDSPALADLGEVVSELVPMFYDIAPDPPDQVSRGTFVPMAGAEAEKWIGRWKACRTPWRAGLPNFERLTLFESDGNLVGHLRQWSPESLAASSLFEPLDQAPGLASYRVIRAGSLDGTALEPGQILAWRAPGEDSLRRLLAASTSSGSRGIVWFALPGPGLRASYSPSHLSALSKGSELLPSLRMRIDGDGRVVLRNDGPADLSIKPGEAPHRLVLEANQPHTFKARGPGRFFSLEPHPDSALSIEFSQRIALSFVELRVGSEIASESGLIPSREGRELRWSLDDSAPVPFE